MPPKQPTPEDQAVAVRITALRKSRGLSQTVVAEALGVTFQQVQKYESAANRISGDRLSKLAILFEVPVSTFFEESAGGAALNTDLFALLEPKGATDLVRAYTAIQDPELRRHTLALDQRLDARAEGYQPPDYTD